MNARSNLTDQKQYLAVAAASADLAADRKEFYFKPPSWLEARLHASLQDQRDLPILYVIYNIFLTVFPAAIALYAYPAWTKALGPAYLAGSYGLFLERYLLALHYSQHRRLFKAGDYI